MAMFGNQYEIINALLAFFFQAGTPQEVEVCLSDEFIEDNHRFDIEIRHDLYAKRVLVKGAVGIHTVGDSSKNQTTLIDDKTSELIFQLRALLADGTELRIPRKNFFKAIQEDVQLEVLTEHDEDFVVIRRK